MKATGNRAPTTRPGQTFSHMVSAASAAMLSIETMDPTKDIKQIYAVLSDLLCCCVELDARLTELEKRRMDEPAYAKTFTTANSDGSPGQA